MRSILVVAGLSLLVLGQFGSISRGDLTLELPNNNPAFTLDAQYGALTSWTDPTFSQLPAVPYIRGIKVSGSATYSSFLTSSLLYPQEAVLGLYASGSASGANYLPDFIYIDYDVDFLKSREINFRFILSVTFHYVNEFTGETSIASNLLDLALGGATNLLSGQMAIDVSQTSGLQGTNYEIYTAVIFDERDLRLGDTFTFQIPSNSIDLGVRARSEVVPEPISLSLALIGGILVVGGTYFRRNFA